MWRGRLRGPAVIIFNQSILPCWWLSPWLNSYFRILTVAVSLLFGQLGTGQGITCKQQYLWSTVWLLHPLHLFFHTLLKVTLSNFCMDWKRWSLASFKWRGRTRGPDWILFSQYVSLYWWLDPRLSWYFRILIVSVYYLVTWVLNRVSPPGCTIC